MLNCWAFIPVAAVYSARIMLGSLLGRGRAADGLDRLTGRVVLRLDHLLVGVEPALVRDEVDHRANDVRVALLDRALQRARRRRATRAGEVAGIDEAVRTLRTQRVLVGELDEAELSELRAVRGDRAGAVDRNLALRRERDRRAVVGEHAVAVLRGQIALRVADELAVARVAQPAVRVADREEPRSGERDVEVVPGRGDRALLEAGRRVVHLGAAAERPDRLHAGDARRARVRELAGIRLRAIDRALRLRLDLQQGAFEPRRVDVGQVVGDRDRA